MNLETLHRYHEDGLLYKQTHPSLPLTIWNYTEKVQYEGLWDELGNKLNEHTGDTYKFIVVWTYNSKEMTFTTL